MSGSGAQAGIRFEQGCAACQNLLTPALRTWENARSPAGIDVRTTKLQLARPSLR